MGSWKGVCSGTVWCTSIPVSQSVKAPDLEREPLGLEVNLANDGWDSRTLKPRMISTISQHDYIIDPTKRTNVLQKDFTTKRF